MKITFTSPPPGRAARPTARATTQGRPEGAAPAPLLIAGRPPRRAPQGKGNLSARAQTGAKNPGLHAALAAQRRLKPPHGNSGHAGPPRRRHDAGRERQHRGACGPRSRDDPMNITFTSPLSLRAPPCERCPNELYFYRIPARPRSAANGMGSHAGLPLRRHDAGPARQRRGACGPRSRDAPMKITFTSPPPAHAAPRVQRHGRPPRAAPKGPRLHRY